MTQHLKKSIISIIFVMLISSILSCGSDDELSVMSGDYLPLDIGNSWVFTNSEDPDTQLTVSITGITALSDGRTATVVTAVEGDDEWDKGYVSKTAEGLLLAHSETDDLEGELFYIPTIKIGSRWEGDRGWAAEVVAREDVNTPAGRFKNCFRLNMLDDGDKFATLWLANNVGPVKLQEIETVGAGSVLSMQFSPDGQTLTSATRNGWITRWNVGTGKRLSLLALKNKEYIGGGASFSPDGAILATGSDDGTVHLWNVRTGEPQQTLIGHINEVHSVSFSPDGKTLASGGSDDTVRLWDVQTGKLRDTLIGHTDTVNSVSFSPDGTTLASGGGGGALLWDVGTGELRQMLRGWHFNSISFSPDGKTLASGSWGQVLLWDVQTGELRDIPVLWEVYFNSVSFSPDGKTLAGVTDGWEGWMYLWDVQTGELRVTVAEYGEDDVNSISFSPDGKTLASGNFDGTVRLWNVSTGQLLQTLEEPTWDEAGETIVLEKYIFR